MTSSSCSLVTTETGETDVVSVSLSEDGYDAIIHEIANDRRAV